jgi:hypothetical protein
MNYLHPHDRQPLLIRPKREMEGFWASRDRRRRSSERPLTTSPDAGTYLNYRRLQRGGSRASHTDVVTYALADLTPACHPHFHDAS